MATHIEPGRFFGSTAARRQVADMVASETVYAPSLVIPAHDHELASLCLVLDGAFDQRYGARRQRECTPGTIIWHPEGERHANTHRRASVRMLCVEIGATRLASMREAVGALDHPAHFAGGDLGRLGARLVGEFHRADGVSALAIEALVLEMVVESHRIATPVPAGAPAWLARAIEYLHAHFAATPTVGEIAEAVGVHPAHLARVFRREQRCTVGDYVRQLRVECARAQLEGSERSLGEIALAAGFADQSHFSRGFRAATGHTPASYRRWCRTRA
jgi:AraC family transcriptional regulator